MTAAQMERLDIELAMERTDARLMTYAADYMRAHGVMLSLDDAADVLRLHAPYNHSPADLAVWGGWPK
jgi:hypothetical protein